MRAARSLSRALDTKTQPEEWRGPRFGKHPRECIALNTEQHTHSVLFPIRLASASLWQQGVSIPPPQHLSSRPHKPQPPAPQSVPASPTYCSCSPTPWRRTRLRGSEGHTEEGAARVSYLDGGQMGVAQDPVGRLKVGQVPLRHVHQLRGVYLVGEMGRAVLQGGRVFILVAVFLGMWREASLAREQCLRLLVVPASTTQPEP